LFWDIDVTPEDAEELIQRAADKIIEYKMETIAILTLESIKPWSFVGGELSRAALAPILPAMGEGMGIFSEKMFRVFEDRANIEKLIKILEEQVKKDQEERKKRKTEEKARREEDKRRKQAIKDALKSANTKNS
jgi:maltose-binding protein MalE